MVDFKQLKAGYVNGFHFWFSTLFDISWNSSTIVQELSSKTSKSVENNLKIIEPKTLSGMTSIHYTGGLDKRGVKG